MHLSSILVAAGILALANATPAPLPTLAAVLPRTSGDKWINYTTLTGFFAQDDAATVPGTFDYVSISGGKKEGSGKERG